MWNGRGLTASERSLEFLGIGNGASLMPVAEKIEGAIWDSDNEFDDEDLGRESVRSD